LRKCHFPLAYLIEPLLFETLWPVLLFVPANTTELKTLALACFGIQVLTNLILHNFKFKDTGAWKSFNWLFAKDAIAPLVWFVGLVSNKVVWRGQTLHLKWGGKLGRKRRRLAWAWR